MAVPSDPAAGAPDQESWVYRPCSNARTDARAARGAWLTLVRDMGVEICRGPPPLDVVVRPRAPGATKSVRR